MSAEGKKIAHDRRVAELNECLGETVRQLLAEHNVTDIMLNPDGKLWVDRFGSGREDTGAVISPDDAETILRLVAFQIRNPLIRKAPIVDNSVLPSRSERISGTICPVTDAPSFAIRIPPRSIMSNFPDGTRKPIKLAAGTNNSGFSGERLEMLRVAVANYKNIAIAGSTGSGKTSLASYLMQDMAERRLLVFEDTRELSITAADHVRFLALKGVITMADLLKLALRYRPDGIIIGETRDGETARVLIQASNTGHRGNITTLHANSAIETMHRLEDLCSNVDTLTPARAIRMAIDVVAFVEKIDNQTRAITEIIETSSYVETASFRAPATESSDQLKTPGTPPTQRPRRSAMKRKIIQVALALACLNASVVLPLPAQSEGIPVFDSVQQALHVKEIALYVKELGVMAQQLNAMIQLVTLQNVAGLVLGEGPGEAFTGLMTSAEGLYSNANILLSNVMMKQARLTGELNSLMPAGSLENLTGQQVFSLVNRWRGMFAQDTIDARVIEAEGLRLQTELRKTAYNGTRQADKARSALGATQGLAHIAAAMAGQLGTLNTTLSLMGQMQANQQLDDQLMGNAAKRLQERDMEILQEKLKSTPVSMRTSPFRWGLQR